MPSTSLLNLLSPFGGLDPSCLAKYSCVSAEETWDGEIRAYRRRACISDGLDEEPIRSTVGPVMLLKGFHTEICSVSRGP